jgi:LysM repeat protein
MRRLVIASALVAALTGLGATAVVAGQQRPSEPVWRHVVQPGETLWELADDAGPERDPREVVDRIIRTNDLDGGRILPGQTLVLYGR